jgi:hypothetical protein
VVDYHGVVRDNAVVEDKSIIQAGGCLSVGEFLISGRQNNVEITIRIAPMKDIREFQCVWLSRKNIHAFQRRFYIYRVSLVCGPALLALGIGN